jgi:hypothetical protein
VHQSQFLTSLKTPDHRRLFPYPYPWFSSDQARDLVEALQKYQTGPCPLRSTHSGLLLLPVSRILDILLLRGLTRLLSFHVKREDHHQNRVRQGETQQWSGHEVLVVLGHVLKVEEKESER